MISPRIFQQDVAMDIFVVLFMTIKKTGINHVTRFVSQKIMPEFESRKGFAYLSNNHPDYCLVIVIVNIGLCSVE